MDSEPLTSESFCSQLTQAAGIPLHGTAARVEVWVLLEFAGGWPAKWLEGNDLPEPVQTWTRRLEEEIPRSRVAFIKRDAAGPRRSLYVAVTDPARPRLHRFSWSEYGDLLDIDVAAVARGESGDEPVDETLVAVCTHGRRDRCCAKFGLPVYRAFAKEPDLTTWEITHVGGHRFAANATVFPSGIGYGYLSPAEVPEVAEAARSDRIHLPNYRGRSHYGGPANAADYFVRRETGTDAEGRFLLESVEETAGGHRVTFLDGGVEHRVDVATTTEPDVASCQKPPKPHTAYHLLRYDRRDRPDAN